MNIGAREKRQRFQAQKMGKMRCLLLLGVSWMTVNDELSLGCEGPGVNELTWL